MSGCDEDRADEPAEDPHADCWGIHLGPDGEHHDCDGRPI